MGRLSACVTAVVLLTSLMVLFGSVMVPSTNAVPPGPTQFRFQGVLIPPGPTTIPMTVMGILTGSLSSGFTGQLHIAATAINHPPNPCFSGGVVGTLIPPGPNVASAMDVMLVIPGKISQPLGPTNCPIGLFHLTIHVFTGRTMLTVEASGQVQQWTGVVSLQMQVTQTNTVTTTTSVTQTTVSQGSTSISGTMTSVTQTTISQQSTSIQGQPITVIGTVHIIVESPVCNPQCLMPSLLLTYLTVPLNILCPVSVTCTPSNYRLLQTPNGGFLSSAVNGTQVTVSGLLVVPSSWSCNNLYVPRVCMSDDIYVNKIS